MCGISGQLNFNNFKPIDVNLLVKMRDSLIHRGPDDAGIYVNGPLGFGFRRLSILDLSEAGHQPFTSEDSRYTIIFNGEIFNYQEFYDELKAKGYRFVSKSDTEVLLYLFIERGKAMLNSLNGMFAFAIWDSIENSLFIARDRIGIKPLYYSIDNDTFFFASEQKAILSAGVNEALNQDYFQELLLFKYIAGQQTIFKHIQRLLPGHCITIKDSKVNITQWWNLSDKIQTNRENLPSNPYNWFEETFYSSVKYRTISDVPLGLMLSGGLDSGAIAEGLHRCGYNGSSAFTVTFKDVRYDETNLAKKVAEKFDLKFHQIENERIDITKELHDASWFNDEPLVHQNDAQMLALTKNAKSLVTVLLSGEGADELMGGYYRYKPLNHSKTIRFSSGLLKLLGGLPSRNIVNRFDKLSRYLKDDSLTSLVLFNASNLYPTDLAAFGIQIDPDQFEYRHQIIRESVNLYPNEPARQAMYFDMFTHLSSVLDRNDRMSMGASIECRVPFLDYRFLEMIPAMPSNVLLNGKKGKHLLCQSIGKRLPPETLAFKKLGFSVPWEQYLRTNPFISEFIEEMENDPIFELPIFEQLPIKKIRSLFLQRVPIGETLIRQLFMLSVWYNTYFKNLANS
ncbi:MAG: asparagine synthase (glutamine-hydrolyzing) [Saprospiraceae bacterium]|nr:asparagine synthase (glutamine-hydrolyzing) [Saprospiraceae bacterium]